jgi:hypothetical protein
MASPAMPSIQFVNILMQAINDENTRPSNILKLHTHTGVILFVAMSENVSPRSSAAGIRQATIDSLIVRAFDAKERSREKSTS